MAPVAHLDLDAFYVAVELARRPELRGLPVVVAGSGPRAVVTTASYEARRYGVGSALPAAKARRLCPHAVFLAPDFACYREASSRVMALVRAAVARVEVVGLDEVYLDLEGLVAPRAAMRELQATIARATALSCSVGIGPNKLVAKVASDAEKPRGFVVLDAEQARRRFASAPPGLLPGVGPKTARRLAELGIATIAALAGASPEALARTFGVRLGPWLVARARFEDGAPVSDRRAVVSESRERTFDVDVSDPAELARRLNELAERLCRDLVRRGRSGRTISIKVRLDDFTTHTRARTLPVAVSCLEEVSPVARALLAEFAPRRPVRLLGVRVAALHEPDVGVGGQLALPL